MDAKIQELSAKPAMNGLPPSEAGRCRQTHKILSRERAEACDGKGKITDAN